MLPSLKDEPDPMLKALRCPLLVTLAPDPLKVVLERVKEHWILPPEDFDPLQLPTTTLINIS